MCHFHVSLLLSKVHFFFRLVLSMHLIDINITLLPLCSHILKLQIDLIYYSKLISQLKPIFEWDFAHFGVRQKVSAQIGTSFSS